MISFEPCTIEHVRLIDAQDSQISEKTFNADVTDELLHQSMALACLINGKPVGAAGLRPIWPGRVVAWALLGRDAGPAMVAIARKIRFVLATCPARRVELTVRASFTPGCRLVALLGFDAEARLLGFFPDGSTALLYSKIRQP